MYDHFYIWPIRIYLLTYLLTCLLTCLLALFIYKCVDAGGKSKTLVRWTNMVKLTVIFFIRFVVNRDPFWGIINADASSRTLNNHELKKRSLFMTQKLFCSLLD